MKRRLWRVPSSRHENRPVTYLGIRECRRKCPTGRSRRGRGALPPFNYRNDGFLFASKTIGNSAHDAQNKQERERGGTVSLNV